MLSFFTNKRSLVNDASVRSVRRISCTIADIEADGNSSYKMLSGGFYILNGKYYDKNNNICYFHPNAFRNV